MLDAAVVTAAFFGAWPAAVARTEAQQPPAVRRVHVPYLTERPFTPAIFWLGRVGPTSNYADVRVWYYDEHLAVILHITDRHLWYANSPTLAQLTAWDAVSLYLDTGGRAGTAPRPTSHWFVKQLGHGDSAVSKAARRGTGTAWTTAAIPFTTEDTWRGVGPNDDSWDMGWQVEFDIPFTSLGLTGPPPPGTEWGLAVVVHDRDDAAGTAIPDQVWPETLQAAQPATWGALQFGESRYTPPTSAVAGTTVVRHGLNGAVVTDAAVGGHTICGDPMNAWTEWGNANYAGYTQFNIQNQWDIADFMCFSKYYVTFPLSQVPPGKAIVGARVRLTLFGNAGYTPSDATPSAINALTVAENWAESQITWNTAPYAAESVSVTWVYPVSAAHPAGPYDWDVSRAAADAYRAGQPLRLVFYSTAGDYHSGKYFYTSDSNDWSGTVRPTLEVQWGESAPVLSPLTSPLRVGGANSLEGGGFTPGTVVQLFVASGAGPQAFGPYTPASRTATSLTWTIPPTVPLGNGYGAVQAINTDAGYAASNVVGALLEGDPADNLPTILYVNGQSLAPADPSIGLAHVDTVISQNSTVAITGTGFKDPAVNLFTAAGNVGPLWPTAGGSSTQVQVTLPPGAPTGPATLQLINAPYAGNVMSNAVAAVIGARPTIDGVSVAGTTVTVTGTGFSALSAINLFNQQGTSVVNLGGLNGSGPRIPLTVVNDRTLTFTVPVGAVAGRAFVEVLNPPYIAFSSTGSDPDGAFILP